MSTKINIAAFAVLLTVLAVPGVASAQEGFGNYASAQRLLNANDAAGYQSRLQTTRQAAHYRKQAYASVEHGRFSTGSGGYGTGPYWQSEPTDRLPIWRYGYYQGNDPDQFIRRQIMRDATNGRK